MLKVIRELGVKLSLVYDKSAMTQAQTAVEKISSNMKSLGMGIGAAAGTMFGFTEATASNARELKLMSDTLGINVEALQEMSYAAKTMANVGRGDLMGALTGVSETLDKVRQGSPEAAMAFNRLGLSADVVSNRNLNAMQIFQMVGERIKDLHDPIARAAIANQIFGASGTKFLPMWMQGTKAIKDRADQARKGGLIFSTSDIERQAKFQEDLNKTFAVIKHLSFVIGDKLMPVVKKVLNDFTKWVVQNQKFITSGIANFIKGLGDFLKVIWPLIMKAANGFKSWVEHTGGAAKAGKILLGVFAAFKAMQIAAGVYEVGSALIAMGMSLARASGMVGLLSAAFGALKGIMTAFSMISGLADIIPALQLAAGSLGTALLPILGYAAALGAVIVVVHDLWVLFTTGDYKQTWLYQLFTWIKDKALAGFESMKNFFGFGEAGAGMNSYAPATPAGSPSVSAGGMNQSQTTINAPITVQVPPGMSASQATDIVSKGTERGISDASLKMTRDQFLGGHK